MAAWIREQTTQTKKKTPTCKNTSVPKVKRLIVIDAFSSHLQVEQSNFRCTEVGYAYKLYWWQFTAVKSVSFYSGLKFWVTNGLWSEVEGKHEMEQTTQWSLKNFCKAHDAMHMIQIKHLW